MRQIKLLMSIALLAVGVAVAGAVENKADGGYDWPGLAVGVKAGTLGLGGDLTVGVGRYVNLRAGATLFAFTMNRTIEDVDYRVEFDLVTFPLLLDVHPFANSFRISGGLVMHGPAKADLSARPNKDVTIGNHKYSPAVIGELSGSIEAGRKMAPYLGIGYGNAVGPDTRWSFVFDLGLIFQTYDVDLSADGPGMLYPPFVEDLERERQKLQDDVDDFKLYPVLAFGLAYHF
ncbi:MAG: hypothetical protein LC725_06175 [Lentisphaerae bacterium]|nr:hypothetical protein [Lentisphaerota bacterium]